jgi:hypothetical protein
MKINYIVILTGILLIVTGLTIISYEIYGDSDFKLNVETELTIIFGFVASGLIISGVGIMMEFSGRKYSVQK